MNDEQLKNKRAIIFIMVAVAALVVGYLFGDYIFGFLFLFGYGLSEIIWPITT